MARWRKNGLIGLVLVLTLGLTLGLNQASIATSAYSPNYEPIAEWMGRLILPTVQQQTRFPGDWVWLEVQHAPDANLQGQTVRLTWNQQPETQAYVKAVTREVRFTAATIDSKKRGNIHPDRLNGRTVGALQSLAGARPDNSVTVRLDRPQIETQSGQVTLKLDRDPIQVSGQFYGLVKLIEPVDRSPKPAVCPGDRPCPSQFFRVQHFRSASGEFDGAIETIKIPQLPPDHSGIFPSTSRDIVQSPAGQAGWYIFGAKDRSGLFVVESIEPRLLVQLDPNQVILGAPASLSNVQNSLWADLTKGTVQTTLLDPTATSEEEARSRWTVGTRALMLHVFGGIGGEKAEPLGVPNTITGHFAFGAGQIDRDPLTNQLRWNLEYEQVYAHNPNGIVSGSAAWENYMGDLDRGWLGTRPVADILIRFDPVLEDYDFDGVKFSPLSEFLRQLRIMMARYRVGDGTGSATVTPATSCIQDSSQALFVAIARLKQQASDPRIQAWLQAHPDAQQTQRFNQLVAFGKAIEADLQPLGIVRADWESSAREQAAIVGVESQPFRDPSVWAGLTTWRTLTPRQAQDELAMQFLRQNAALWILRTNQVGGWDGSIAPLAPTALLGEITIPNTQVSPVTILLNRLLASLSLPNWRDTFVVLASLGIYAAIAIPIGLRHRLLRLESANLSAIETGLLSLRVLFAPALIEELLFRVLLLPHPSTIIREVNWWLWAIASLILFILYHPLNAKTLYRAGASTFTNVTFLQLAGLLGIVCTIAYRITESLLVIVIIHWAIVTLWLLYFGGLARLQKPIR